MPNLAPARNRFRTIAIALGVIAAAALLYLVTPLGSVKDARYKELNDAQRELMARRDQLAPLRGLPEKVKVSQGDIEKFRTERFAARFSVISSEIGKIAAKNNVTLSGVRYEAYEAALSPFQEVVIQADLSGNYGNVAKFINAVERNKLFFVIEQIGLADEREGKVRLSLSLTTYMHPDGVKGTPSKKTETEEDAD